MPLYYFKNPAKNLKDANFQHLTLVIPLRKLNKHKEDKLAACRHEFTRAVSYFINQSRLLNTTSPYKLHKLLNQTAKEKFNLPSALLQSARDRGVAIQRIFWARVKKRLPTSPPVIKKDVPIHLRQGSYKIFKNTRGSWMIKFVYLPGRSKYLVLPLAVRPYVRARLEDNSSQLAACEIYRRKMKDPCWLLSIIVKIPIARDLTFTADVAAGNQKPPATAGDSSPEAFISKSGGSVSSAVSDVVALTDEVSSSSAAENGGAVSDAPKIIGVDLGIRHNAVLSIGKFMGPRYLLKKYGIYAKKKFSSAATDLKKSRFVSYINHLISRDIVSMAKKENAIIALEDLTGLKTRVLNQKDVFIRSLCNWSYRRLSNYIKYKAALAGVRVAVVDPANTSSTCSRCNYVSCVNREFPGNFVCKFCGFELNPDLNAARMIARFAAENFFNTKKNDEESASC